MTEMGNKKIVKVFGLKELVSRKDLTPDDMVGFKIFIEFDDGSKDYMIMSELEIQIEFLLRGMGMVGEEKEKQRFEMFNDVGHDGDAEIWKIAME